VLNQSVYTFYSNIHYTREISSVFLYICFRYLLVACCIAVLSLRLRKETPRGENSVCRLPLSAGHWLI